MKQKITQRATSLLILGIGIVAIFVLGISWFQTSSRAAGDTEIKGADLRMVTTKIGSNGIIRFVTKNGDLRSNLYIYENNLLNLSNGEGEDKLTVNANGKIFANGIGQISSRSVKDNITNLSEGDALTAFTQLQPVLFNYKGDTDQQAGFIAEDVPSVIAAPDHKSINPLEVTALITSVVKTQQKQLEMQEKQIQEMRREIEALKRK